MYHAPRAPLNWAPSSERRSNLSVTEYGLNRGGKLPHSALTNVHLKKSPGHPQISQASATVISLTGSLIHKLVGSYEKFFPSSAGSTIADTFNQYRIIDSSL